MGFPELKGIFTKRNNYTKTYENNSYIKAILDELKKIHGFLIIIQIVMEMDIL